MPMSLWKGALEVNKQYQEMIKVVINLATASLVLPVVFLKNILDVKTSITGHLYPWAYWAWFLLVLSLCACLACYLFSTKLTKAMYKDPKKNPGEIPAEHWRDRASYVAAPSFVLGLIFLLIFFLYELSGTSVVAGG